MKPAREVKVGEVVNVRKGAVMFSHEVVSFPRARVGRLVPTICATPTAPEEKEKLKIRLAQQDGPKGGAPDQARPPGLGKGLQVMIPRFCRQA